tara:strand:- start:5765 stop:6019 length:255 start_codon:yes stop_codon:yes gene_type:complete
MKTMYKMKEATNKLEAIISILDVMKENPIWLNKCTSKEFIVVYRLHNTKKREEWLNLMTFSDVRDLFIEIKKEYYNSIDWTNKF